MVVIGLLFFAGAIGTGTTLVLHNRGQGAVPVHAFNHTLELPAYAVMAAGAAIVVIALIGLAMMRLGARRTRRLRADIETLLAEHARLTRREVAGRDLAEYEPTGREPTGREAEPEPSFFFETFDDDLADQPEPSWGDREPAAAALPQ